MTQRTCSRVSDGDGCSHHGSSDHEPCHSQVGIRSKDKDDDDDDDDAVEDEEEDEEDGVACLGKVLCAARLARRKATDGAKSLASSDSLSLPCPSCHSSSLPSSSSS